MTTLTELAGKEDLLVAGHGLCAGCAISPILKVVLRAAQYPLVIANETGCLQMTTTHFPRTSWKLNWIHSAYGNSAATISGVETMYRSLRKQGKFPLEKELKFLVISGDGAANDAGLGGLSGAIERGHQFVYLCLDNQMYASTGGQRSSAAVMGTSATDAPVGVLPGKMQARKDIAKIMAAHKIPYLGQSAPWNWHDLYKKAERAFDTPGPTYLNVLSPCPFEWKTPTRKSIELTRLAADTCIWPVYEVKNGSRVTVNYKPRKKLAVTEWFHSQPRFKHLAQSENKWIVDKIQEEVDKDWEFLLSAETEQKFRDN
ncbi:MAG: thiamine pyrophosphate-dependent enzyme [Acidobacteria bacterium]|jgi:pyruvate ferredoxin oxidoreductase beta subunit|nr:thiamine pyrophosphate-dependent enzyme [Acidobacteriota bacterium]